MSDIELFDGLVSPEIAGVLDEAMRAMPDAVAHVTPGQAGSDRVHVSIGGEMYDLMVTLDGDTVASFKLVPVCVGRAGNAVAVLKAGLGVLAVADGIEQTEASPPPISSATFVEYVHRLEPSARVVTDQQGGSRNAVTVWLGRYVLFVRWRTGFCEWSIGRIGGGRVYDLRAGSPLEGLETLQRLASMAPLKGE